VPDLLCLCKILALDNLPEIENDECKLLNLV